MRSAGLFFALGAWLASAAALGAAPPAAPGPEAVDFFETKVRPVLAENCLSCHGPKRQRGGLRLDSRDTALRGGDAGLVVVPGEPEKSRLVRAVRHDGELKMPPKGKLGPGAVEALTAWVRLG